MAIMNKELPEHRRNRGKDPHDEALFGSAKERGKLLLALDDMLYLLTKDYPPRATLALVGNRYRLRQRQLLALQGMACSEQDRDKRQAKEVDAEEIRNQLVYLDGFNILIILESLFSGGYVFKGLDGCYRDISSVHGSYKRVKQTENVLVRVGEALQKLGAKQVVWVFDAPVSNSGRLKVLCYEIAAAHGFAWDILLDNAPDKFLVAGNRLVVSSDAWVLNGCAAWFNLAGYIIDGATDQNVIFQILKPEVS